MYRRTTALLALLALTACALLPDNLTGDNETRRAIRNDPVRNAYNKYWTAASDASNVLKNRNLSFAAPNLDASIVIDKLRWEYYFAGCSALTVAVNTYADAEDAARVRATADSKARHAADSFAASRDQVRLWCDNYLEIERAVRHADELAEKAAETQTLPLKRQ